MFKPNVITEKTIGRTIVRVVAYRKLTESEFLEALQTWIKTKRLTSLPANETITIQSAIGKS